MLKAMAILGNGCYELIYGPSERAEIARLVRLSDSPQTPDTIRKNFSILNDVDIIFSGWGGPKMDEKFLAAAPKLKIVFYGAGSVKNIVTDEFWRKGILISSAYAANAIPVAEYTLSQILFCLKQGWHFAVSTKTKKSWSQDREHVIGAYGTTVGIISLGLIATKVIELLEPFDVNILVCSGHLTKKKAAEMNVERCSMEDIFNRADVVSLHSPLSDQTRGMVTGKHFASMKPYASFINTARGAIVRENELIEVFRKRPDLSAVLDVTDPEPPEADSPLYTLPNIIVTPHIAGSMGQECWRLGRYMLEELRRYLNGDQLEWELTRENTAYLA
ncbi:MAG: hydroxyacid dehydrogenase [Planctomycetota bacterium]